MTSKRIHEPSVKRRRQDMAPLARAGGAIPMGANQACRLLGCSLNSIFKLCHLGAIEFVRTKGAKHDNFTFWLSPDDDRTTIYRRWCARVKHWNHRAAVRHKDLRGACAISGDEPQPGGLDEFAARVFGAIGVSGRVEATSFFVDTDRKAADRDRVRLLMTSSALVGAAGSRYVALEPKLAAIMYPELAGLPDSCLDPLAGDVAAPEGRVIARALAVPMLGGAAVMFILLAAAPGKSKRLLLAYVRSFRLVAERLQQLGHTKVTGQGLQQALMEMLDDAKPGGSGAAGLYQACCQYRTAARYLRGYVSRVDASGSRGLARLLPPELPNYPQIQRAILSVGKSVHQQGQGRRIRMGDPVAERLDLHERAAQFTLDQITAIHEDSLIAADELRRHVAVRDTLPEEVRQRTPAFIEFIVPVAKLDARGELVRGEAAELVFWAWRERDAWLSLEPDALRIQRGMSRRRRANVTSVKDRALIDAALHMKIADVHAHPEKYEDVVFEYRGVARVAGTSGRPDRRYDPRFITLCRFGVDVGPSYLTARRQRQRHRLLQNWNIAPCYRSPEGLLRFGNASTLARWMDARNRLFIPIAERYHATRIAVFGFDVIAQTLCRAAEAIQPIQDLAGWITNDASGEVMMAFMAATKASGRTLRAEELKPMGISETLFVEAMSLAEELATTNGHDNGWLPKVYPAEGVPKQAVPGSGGKIKPVEPAAYILQWRGKHILPGVLGELIRSLFSNRGIVTPHLVRRGGANRLRELGVPEPVVQAILGHSSLKMSLWYMMETVRQAARRSKANNDHRRVEAALAHGRYLARDKADSSDDPS